MSTVLISAVVSAVTSAVVATVFVNQICKKVFFELSDGWENAFREIKQITLNAIDEIRREDKH